MSSGFPANTIVLLLVALISFAAASWVVFFQAIQRMRLSPAARRTWMGGIGIFLTAWFGIPLILAIFPPRTGFLAAAPTITIASIVIGLLVGVAALWVSSTFRQILQAIPVTHLIGVHVIRIEGFFFLALLDMHRLPPEFALPAGYGDVLTGMLALGLIALIARRIPHAERFVAAWNLLGLLDLVNALATGITFIGPFARQAAASGTSLGYLNFVFLVPAFGVPLLILLHTYSLYQVFSRRVSVRGAAHNAAV
jgi:hypothetical protein